MIATKAPPSLLKARLQKVIATQRDLQASRLATEQKIDGQLKELGQRLGQNQLGFKAPAAPAGKAKPGRPPEGLSIATSLAAIASELASLRDLTERARSSTAAATALIAKSQAVCDTIGTIAAQSGAGASPAGKIRIAARASLAQNQVHGIQDEAQEEREAAEGGSMKIG